MVRMGGWAQGIAICMPRGSSCSVPHIHLRRLLRWRRPRNILPAKTDEDALVGMLEAIGAKAMPSDARPWEIKAHSLKQLPATNPPNSGQQQPVRACASPARSSTLLLKLCLRCTPCGACCAPTQGMREMWLVHSTDMPETCYLLDK